jgi:hypothetical protein
MWIDAIVEEAGRVRPSHAARFTYDPDAIDATIKTRHEATGRTYFRRPVHTPAVTDNHSHTDSNSSPFN